jgi:hypothetical protein
VTVTLPDLDTLPRLIRDAADAPRPSRRSAWFRIGDAHLEVRSDEEPLFRELETVYGDCAVPPPPPAGARLRCTVSALRGRSHLLLAFDGPRVPDPLETARGPYRFLLHQRYVEVPGPLPGWRQLVQTDAGHRLLMASNGTTALVNVEAAPPEFVVDCIVGVAQRAQTGVLFLHAASVGIAGRGALLIGATGGGKSTMALALASRGHAFLGDDVAAVRLATQELLPFPKSAGLRDGPLARLLEERVRASRHAVAPNRHGMARTLVRVGDLFEAPPGRPLALDSAFLLDGFAERAAITPYEPRIADARRLQSVVTDTSSAWGLSPGRDLMNYLVVVDLLSRLRCHVLRLGAPEETARLIEAAMERPCP